MNQIFQSKSNIYHLTLFMFFLMASCKNNKKDLAVLPKDPTERGIALYTDSILSAPKNAVYYYERALLYWKKNEMELALNDFYKVNVFDSTNAKYYATIGEFMLENGNMDRATMALNKAIEFAPENPYYHMLAGKFHIYSKDYQTAINHLNNALKREPTFAEAYFYKGFAYKESNNFEKALSNFTTATEQNPSWDEPYEQIGELYAQRKDSKAIVYFDNAVKVNRQNTSARLSKAYFYKTIGKLEMAENAYNDIIALFPQNVDAIYSIGVINFEKKKYDVALKQFNIATKVDPTFPDSYFMIGKIEKINGNKEKAKAAFKQALVFDAEFKEAQDALNSLK